MATLKAFSIYDIKAEVFSPPFFMATNGEAVRAFRDLVNDRGTMPGKHPADFRLSCIGEFDNVTGEFKDSKDSGSLGFGSDYVSLPSTVTPIGVGKVG